MSSKDHKNYSFVKVWTNETIDGSLRGKPEEAGFFHFLMCEARKFSGDGIIPRPAEWLAIDLGFSLPEYNRLLAAQKEAGRVESLNDGYIKVINFHYWQEERGAKSQLPPSEGGGL